MFTFKPAELRRRLASASVSPFHVESGGRPRVNKTEPGSFQLSLFLGKYELRLAQALADREAACRLRFKVFNIELGEGLDSSYWTGLDPDHFDLFCHHLIVEDRSRREVVGTYRMQSGQTASHNLGYYSEQEFNFAREGGGYAEKDEASFQLSALRFALW